MTSKIHRQEYCENQIMALHFYQLNQILSYADIRIFKLIHTFIFSCKWKNYFTNLLSTNAPDRFQLKNSSGSKISQVGEGFRLREPVAFLAENTSPTSEALKKDPVFSSQNQSIASLFQNSRAYPVGELPGKPMEQAGRGRHKNNKYNAILNKTFNIYYKLNYEAEDLNPPRAIRKFAFRVYYKESPNI